MGLMEDMGPAAFGLGLKVGLGLAVVVILAVLFFVSKYFSAWYKKRKSYKVTAVIFHPDGSFTVSKMGKFRGKDNIDKMEFLGNNETMPVIPPKYIRSSTVCLWRYDVGQYAVIPPQVWMKNPKEFKIEVVDMQMKNFVFLEQRAAVSRWSYIKDAMQKYAPFITIMVLAIAGGVTVWLVMKSALGMFDSATAQRTAECMKILGSGLTPPA